MHRIFIETEVFTRLVEEQNSSKLLEIIQQEVLRDINLPLANRDFIQGSGAFAKVRVAAPKNRKGKSGGFRVIYFDLPVNEITFLFLLYPKSVKENLTQKQVAALKAASQELKAWQPRKKQK
ncbi:MAG: type II toxin-antitoxin system RelE/ParE family toxin [Bacteriovoracaceae bacterium]